MMDEEGTASDSAMTPPRLAEIAASPAASTSKLSVGDQPYHDTAEGIQQVDDGDGVRLPGACGVEENARQRSARICDVKGPSLSRCLSGHATIR